MKKTSSEAIKYLYRHLSNSMLMIDAGKPNGRIYEYQRPEGSTKEDVVIDMLAMDRQAVQEGILQVNIWVNNREVKDPVTGVIDRTLPDTLRLEYLERLAEDVLTDVWGPDADYTFTVQQSRIIPDTNNQHFIHIRLEFFTQTLN